MCVCAFVIQMSMSNEENEIVNKKAICIFF